MTFSYVTSFCFSLARVAFASLTPLAAAGLVNVSGVDGQAVAVDGFWSRLALAVGSGWEVGLFSASVVASVLGLAGTAGARGRFRVLCGVQLVDAVVRGAAIPVGFALPGVGKLLHGLTAADDLCCVLPAQALVAAALLFATRPQSSR
ncbi:MAG: hypothetical protein ACOZNI_02920 [Myxococcota bacterium]